jgi:class 3 adenylate cyclase
MAAMDLDALAAAGLRDAHLRGELIEFLAERGFTAEQMVEADARGRLFGLAGDVHVRSGPARYSLALAADALGLPLAEVQLAWSAMGLTVVDADEVALSEADLDGLRTWSEVRALVGWDVALGLLRVLGAAMARLAEAESAAIRAGVQELQLDYTDDEAQTARAWADVAPLVPRIGALMDAAHRQHLEAARVYFEGVVLDTSATVVCGVGFADLSGFTALSRQLSLAELSGLLNTFGSTAADVVQQHSGRLVKLLGDAVMWVSADAAHLAEVATHLVHHPLAEQAGIAVRAGLAYGPSLAQGGDYFGPAVNLAARLVAIAQPGQILASAEVAERLDGWRDEPLAPVTLRGFDESVVPHLLHRKEG